MTHRVDHSRCLSHGWISRTQHSLPTYISPESVMHFAVLGLCACLGICAATAAIAKDEVVGSEAGGQGLPPQPRHVSYYRQLRHFPHLTPRPSRILNATAHPNKKLSLPIDIDNEVGVAAVTEFRALDPPKGRHLVYSILRTVYPIWANNYDPGFRGVRGYIQEPFRDLVSLCVAPEGDGWEFHHSDVAYLHMYILRSAIRDEQTWPGYINSSLYETDDAGEIEWGRRVGSVCIFSLLPLRFHYCMNDPKNPRATDLRPLLDQTAPVTILREDEILSVGKNETMSVLWSSGNITDPSDSTLQRADGIAERAWLDLIYQMMTYVFAHKFDSWVEPHLPAGREMIWCTDFDPTAQGILTITQYAATHGEPLTWQRVGSLILRLVLKGAETDPWRSPEKADIAWGGKVIAQVWFTKRRAPINVGSPAQSGIATA